MKPQGSGWKLKKSLKAPPRESLRNQLKHFVYYTPFFCFSGAKMFITSLAMSWEPPESKNHKNQGETVSNTDFPRSSILELHPPFPWQLGQVDATSGCGKTSALREVRYVMALAAGRKPLGPGKDRNLGPSFMTQGLLSSGPQNDANHTFDFFRLQWSWMGKNKNLNDSLMQSVSLCMFLVERSAAAFFWWFSKNCSSNKHLVHYLICLAQCSWQKDISITALQTWHMQSNNPETLLMWQEKYVCNLFRFLLPVSQLKVIGFFSETI